MSVKAKINNTSIKALQIEDKRINDTEVSGFHARISSKGKITYYLFYRINSKQANFCLGIHGQVTPTQARDLAKNKAAEITKGVDVQSKKKENKEKAKLAKLSTLSIFIEQKYQPWLETRNAKTAKATIDNLTAAFPHFFKMQLDEINAWQVEKWRSEKRKSGLKPSSINRRLNDLKGCLSRAVEWEIIDNHDLNKVKALKVDNAKVRYLTADENKRLRNALRKRDIDIKSQRKSANEHRTSRGYELLPDLTKISYVDYLEPVVLLAINTGMRRGELLSLTWANVEVNNEFKTLTIVSDNAKSGKTRHIPLNNEASRVLSNWQQYTGDQGLVFKGKDGKQLKEMRKSWNNLLERAEISDFRFHDLRHDFASKLVMAGVDLNTVRELLGHADLAMTLRYAHLAPEHKAAAVNLIG